ncbi:MAG: C4-dicarboxylate ABC transporter permease [Geminicoccus sp.]|nr:C4-dicarboxylate ABC transporter permease [Geminicoccus sp.]
MFDFLDPIQTLLAPHLAWVLILGVFGLLAIRAPIGVALGLPSIMVVLIKSEKATSLATAVVGAMNEKFLLTAIPFFILSSAFLTSGGAAKRIVDFAVAAVGQVRGGMGVAGVFSCMLFAALSGSSPSTVAAIGPIAIKGMEDSNYPKGFATGLIATAGTLGILIPPSIVMVVYAAATNESVGRLFLAGVMPGLLAGAMLVGGILIGIGRMKIEKPFWYGFRDALRKGVFAVPGLLLIVLIIWGIYAGFFTPTEAAAFAAVYGFVTATVFYRGIGFLKNSPWRREGESLPASAGRAVLEVAWSLPANLVHRETRGVLLNAAKMSVMLMFIIFNALIFSHVLTELRIPQQLASAIVSADMPPWVFLIIINLILLIGGQFMEPSGLLLIVAPIVYPLAMQLGIDPIHLGIIMVVNMEIGMITPPVGLNLFVASSITRMGILKVMQVSLPWVGVLFLFLIIVTYIPGVSLWLPDLAYGPR